MRNSMKKSLIFLSIISSIPVVYAQGEISNAFGGTISLFFSLVKDILTTLLDALKSDPIYGKAFIAAFMGIFFYSELKQMDVFKKNIKLAGFVAVLIALMVAFWLPGDITGLLFSETTPFIGFVISGFILLIAGNRGNWSHTARGIAFIVLMMSFGAIINLFPSWAQVIVAGFIIASLISAIYNFTRLKTSEESRGKEYKEMEDEDEEIERVIEDNPNASDEDIADYLTKSTGEEVKPNDVRLVREEKPISNKEERKITKRLYSKPIIKKGNELDISHAIKELDRENYLARDGKNMTDLTIQDLERGYSQARKLLHKLTNLPIEETKKIRNITYEIISKILLDTSIVDDNIKEVSHLEEGILRNINELDKEFVFIKDKKLYKLSEGGFKKYKADILNLMDTAKKSDDFIKSLQQKILRDTNKLIFDYKENEIEQRDLIDRINKVLMYCEEQLRAVADKSNIYLDMINRSNIIKAEIKKLSKR